MKPFYVCEVCTSSYEEDLRGNKSGHYVALSNEHPQSRKCLGTLKPAFFADDLLKEIEERTTNLNKIKEEMKAIYNNDITSRTEVAFHEFKTFAAAIKGE